MPEGKLGGSPGRALIGISRGSKSKNNNSLTKNVILNQWCALEAAIKWDHGKLAQDINHWQFFEKPKELIHNLSLIHI